MLHWGKILQDATVISKAVLFDGKLAGNVVSFEKSGARLIGYWFGKEFWGKGIASDAVSQFLKHETTRPLYARVARHNIASFRVLEKCGFKVDGENTFKTSQGDEIREFVLILRPMG
jgi:RimJ/RimL family protein N-acetyltransferase